MNIRRNVLLTEKMIQFIEITFVQHLQKDKENEAKGISMLIFV